MNTKTASQKFNIPERSLRQLYKENKIKGATKNRYYDIPDNTLIIITDNDAKSFLLYVLKLKNNPATILPVDKLKTDM